MLNAIEVLDSLGRRAIWNDGRFGRQDSVLPQCDFADEQKQLLASGDYAALNLLLGGRRFMAMHVATPDTEDAPEEAPRREHDEPAPEDLPERAD